MNSLHRKATTVCVEKCVRSGRLAYLLIGVSVVLMMGTSLDGLWLKGAAAADGDGGSTIPIPPPDRPTPRITDLVPSETPSSPVEPVVPTAVPTVAGTSTQESGPRSSLALWFGIGLGAVGLVGLATGAYIILFSQRRRRGA